MSWIKESNRPKHVFYGFLSALFGTILFCFGLALGKEFADRQWGGKFDWLDLLATLIGGIVGQIVQLFILSIWIYLI